MTNLLLSYYDQLDQLNAGTAAITDCANWSFCEKRKHNGKDVFDIPFDQHAAIIDARIAAAAIKKAALSSWPFCKKQINDKGVAKIVIPKVYALYAKSLVDVFANENFPHGKEYFFGTPSDETQTALSLLFKILLPESAVHLDYLNIELLHFAIFAALYDCGDRHLDYYQENAFFVLVIGLVQSVFTPEMAKIFCEGLYQVVMEHQNPGPRANSLKLPIDPDNYDAVCFPYYRSSRNVHDGQGLGGGKYFCGAFGKFTYRRGNGGTGSSSHGAGIVARLLELLMLGMDKRFLEEIAPRLQQQTGQQCALSQSYPEDRHSGSCNLF